MSDAFTYNGTGLSTYSVELHPARTSGLRALATLDHDAFDIRRRNLPGLTYKGRRGGDLVLGGHISGTTRANYQSNVTTFKAAIRPVVTSGSPVYKALTWDQLANRRLMVLTVDFDLKDISDKRGEFTWTLLRYPFWQGSSQTTEAAADADLVLNNPGDLTAEPVWTVTVLDTLAGGYSFTVNGTLFQYTGALANTDVLTIDSAAKTVKLNGVLDYANVGTSSGFPTLAAGNNTVSGRTCLDADATLSATFYAEYEA